MPNRPQRNNNPGNLKFAGQREAVGRDDAGHAVFPTPWAGWRALLAQLRLDQRRGLTVRQWIYRYAPPGENRTEDYLRYLCAELNCSTLTLLADLSAFALAGVVANYEGYFAKEG
jgi:hypothetical protein